MKDRNKPARLEIETFFFLGIRFIRILNLVEFGMQLDTRSQARGCRLSLVGLTNAFQQIRVFCLQCAKFFSVDGLRMSVKISKEQY